MILMLIGTCTTRAGIDRYRNRQAACNEFGIFLSDLTPVSDCFAVAALPALADCRELGRRARSPLADARRLSARASL